MCKDKNITKLLGFNEWSYFAMIRLYNIDSFAMVIYVKVVECMSY